MINLISLDKEPSTRPVGRSRRSSAPRKHARNTRPRRDSGDLLLSIQRDTRENWETCDEVWSEMSPWERRAKK